MDVEGINDLSQGGEIHPLILYWYVQWEREERASEDFVCGCVRRVHTEYCPHKLSAYGLSGRGTGMYLEGQIAVREWVERVNPDCPPSGEKTTFITEC